MEKETYEKLVKTKRKYVTPFLNSLSVNDMRMIEQALVEKYQDRSVDGGEPIDDLFDKVSNIIQAMDREDQLRETSNEPTVGSISRSSHSPKEHDE